MKASAATMNRTGLLILRAISLLPALEQPRPMEDKKTVNVERGLLSTRFKQDGHLVKPLSM
jgi:hypothetical protein